MAMNIDVRGAGSWTEGTFKIENIFHLVSPLPISSRLADSTSAARLHTIPWG